MMPKNPLAGSRAFLGGAGLRDFRFYPLRVLAAGSRRGKTQSSAAC
jgi:hypothetical protein